MSQGKLKTAVLGLDDGGQLLLKAATQTDYFQIQAVADRDTTLAEKTADEYKCAFYDDYRQLVIQNQLDCLLVAAGMYSCEKQIRLAMNNKFNVFKLAPAARNFEEAAEFVQLAKDENIKFAVANPLRFAQSFLALGEFLQQGRIEQVFLITAFCNFGQFYQQDKNQHKEHLAVQRIWQTDPKLAGGGVLLRNCYGMIDQIILNFGVPEQIYSLNTNQAQDKQQRLYLTEDTAVVTMKFNDTLIGNLIAFQRDGIGPKEEFLRIYGKDKVLTVSDRKLAISDGLVKTAEESVYDDDNLCRMARQMTNFALSILLPDENKLNSSGEENLKDMAVIESAYLSARTAMPEEPGRILQMAQRRAGTPADI